MSPYKELFVLKGPSIRKVDSHRIRMIGWYDLVAVGVALLEELGY